MAEQKGSATTHTRRLLLALGNELAKQIDEATDRDEGIAARKRLVSNHRALIMLLTEEINEEQATNGG